MSSEQAKKVAQEWCERWIDDDLDDLAAAVKELTAMLLEARLADALAVRAAYHGHEELGRQLVIVKYMDKQVSDLERQLSAARGGK